MKQLKQLINSFPNDNVTLYQKENNLEHQNCQAEILNGITTNAYYYAQSKTNYIASLYTKAKEFSESAYAGSDSHEQALQGQIEYIDCQEVSEVTAKQFFEDCKALYKEITGMQWQKPLTKEQRELQVKANRTTASSVRLEEKLALRNAV
jgi:hypothetical protein